MVADRPRRRHRGARVPIVRLPAALIEFLREPPKDDNISVTGFDPAARAFSASHTINGQSITLRVRYGNVRFFLGGDLSQQAMAAMNARHSKAELASEILKIPHHGSADFDLRLLKAISPAISLISSGDESSRTEYMHPRATLVGALGRIARTDGERILVFTHSGKDGMNEAYRLTVDAKGKVTLAKSIVRR
jgi:beta-lactamase superfamily II metal-dependent hydrolase